MRKREKNRGRWLVRPGSAQKITNCYRRPLRQTHERIRRTTTYYKDGRRQRTSRQEVKRRNPEKLTIDKGGFWEVFTYPYSNDDYIFLGMDNGTDRVMDRFSIDDAIRIFRQISKRLMTYRNRVKGGVKRLNSSGRNFQRAFDAGVVRQFGEKPCLPKQKTTGTSCSGRIGLQSQKGGMKKPEIVNKEQYICSVKERRGRKKAIAYLAYRYRVSNEEAERMFDMNRRKSRRTSR